MNDTPATILVVEDDEATRRFLVDELKADGYLPLAAETGRDALRLAATKYPDVAIVDVALPDGSGLDLISRVRSADGDTPLDAELPMLVLSGRCSDTDRVRAFDRGADDFLAKPFHYPELRGRIEALLRRADRRRRTGRLRVGELEIDPVSRTVTLAGRPVELTQKEFALLRVLAAEPTRVFTKDELLRTVWGFRSRGNTRTLDSHACRLRQKLGSAHGRWVINIWGVGYRLVDQPAAA